MHQIILTRHRLHYSTVSQEFTQSFRFQYCRKAEPRQPTRVVIAYHLHITSFLASRRLCAWRHCRRPPKTSWRDVCGDQRTALANGGRGRGGRMQMYDGRRTSFYQRSLGRHATRRTWYILDVNGLHNKFHGKFRCVVSVPVSGGDKPVWSQ